MEFDSKTRPDITVLCAISHGLYKPWVEILLKGQVPTWLSAPKINGFEVVHFHGQAGGLLVQKYDRLHEKLRWKNRWTALPLRILDDLLGLPFRLFIPSSNKSSNLSLSNLAIEIDLVDVYATMKWKDLAIFSYFIRETDFDFLFMTTTSSYIRPRKLLEILKGMPKFGLYAGARAYEGADFAAGHNRIFSRDVVEKIIEARGALSCSVVEDLAVGNLCKSLGIPFVQISKIDIDSIEMLNSLSDQEIKAEFHFRLKSGSIEKRQDVEIMRQLHERVRLIDGR